MAEGTIKKQVKTQKIKILLSGLVGAIGSGIFTFGIGIMILRETGSATNFGFSQIIGPIISLLLLPFTGSIVDKYNHKKIVVLAQLASILAIGVFLVGDYYQWMPRLLLIYLLLTVLKLTDLFLFTTYSSSFITMVPKEEIQSLLSFRQMLDIISRIAAPILGAIVFGLVSFRAFVGIEIASEILTLLLVLTIHFYMFQSADASASEEDQGTQGQKEKGLTGMIQSFKEGVTYVKGHTALRFLVLFSMFVNLVFSGMIVGLPYIQIKIFHFSDPEFGSVQALFSVGMFLAGLFLSQYKNLKKPLFFSWVCMFPLLFLTALISVMIYFPIPKIIRYILMLIFVGCSGVFVGFMNIPLGVWVTKEVPPHVQGRVFNLISTSSQLLLPVGILFYSHLIDANIGTDLIFLGMAVIGTLVVYAMPKILKVNMKEI